MSRVTRRALANILLVYLYISFFFRSRVLFKYYLWHRSRIIRAGGSCPYACVRVCNCVIGEELCREYTAVWRPAWGTD